MNEDGTPITYKLNFMDSYRFMNRPLSTLADNFSEINECKCKNPNEQCIHTKRKNDVLICTCKTCNNKSHISIDTLRERFPRLYKFSKGDKDKLILLLRKGVYPYDYMDSWERFNETKLPDKKSFYNKLNQEDITNKEHKHGRNVWKTYGMQNMGEYHDLHVQSDTIMLTDIFENFRNTCMKIYETWEACLK